MAMKISTGFITTKINGITINTSKKCHSSNYQAYNSRNVKYVVMHYTGNKKDTASANANYFQSANRQASAHFFVDNNNIYQSVALKNVAWHCGGSTYYHKTCRNSNSFGIEMCCTADNYKISQQTIENAAYLCANLCKRIGITASQVDTYVLRHYDITHKKCPAQMANSTNDADWVAFKKLVKKILGEKATTSTATPTTAAFKVKVTTDVLNIRAGAGLKYDVVGSITDKGTYTIVETKKADDLTWGKLKSGVGWISLYYTERI